MSVCVKRGNARRCAFVYLGERGLSFKQTLKSTLLCARALSLGALGLVVGEKNHKIASLQTGHQFNNAARLRAAPGHRRLRWIDARRGRG